MAMNNTGENMNYICNSHGWVGQSGCPTCAAKATQEFIVGSAKLYPNTDETIAQLRAELRKSQERIKELTTECLELRLNADRNILLMKIGRLDKENEELRGKLAMARADAYKEEPVDDLIEAALTASSIFKESEASYVDNSFNAAMLALEYKLHALAGHIVDSQTFVVKAKDNK
jgi:hypothetical protein